MRGVGDVAGAVLEVHHEAVVHGVQRHLHRSREVARTAALAVGILDDETAGGLEGSRAVDLRQRDVLFESGDQREDLERRPGLQACLREVPALGVVPAVVAPDATGLRVDGDHRRDQVLGLAVELAVGALVDLVLPAGRLHHGVLHLRVDRGGDLEPARAQLTLADADRVEFLEHPPLDEPVGARRHVGGVGARLDGLRELRLRRLLLGDGAGGDHAVENVTPTGLGGLGVGRGVVVGRRADDAGQQRRLLEGERVLLRARWIGDRLVEVLLGRDGDAVGTPTEIDGVEVGLEDLLLGPAVPLVHLGRDREFLELAAEAALAADDRVLHVLLGDRRTPAGGRVAGDLADDRS